LDLAVSGVQFRGLATVEHATIGFLDLHLGDAPCSKLSRAAAWYADGSRAVDPEPEERLPTSWKPLLVAPFAGCAWVREIPDSRCQPPFLRSCLRRGGEGSACAMNRRAVVGWQGCDGLP
jgi:hypothetical protein